MSDMGTDKVNWGSTTSRPISTHEGANWVLFAGIMILIVGVLNVIWGIAAIGNSRFFVREGQAWALKAERPAR